MRVSQLKGGSAGDMRKAQLLQQERERIIANRAQSRSNRENATCISGKRGRDILFISVYSRQVKSPRGESCFSGRDTVRTTAEVGTDVYPRPSSGSDTLQYMRKLTAI